MASIGPIWFIDILLALASGALVMWVASMYFRSRMVIRSGISMALVVLMVLIAVKNIAGAIIYFNLSRFYGADVGLHMMPLSILDLIIVSILLWIVRK